MVRTGLEKLQTNEVSSFPCAWATKHPALAAARFGRNMEYYTGFVFELWSRDSEGSVQVAGGGRYDTLLEALGAKRPVPAIGCALRTERVLAARRLAGDA